MLGRESDVRVARFESAGLEPSDAGELDAAVCRLFASLELEPTLDAVAAVLYPRWAAWLSIAIEDDRGVTWTRTVGGRPDGATDLSFTLTAEQHTFGALRLAASQRAAGERADLERIVGYASQAIVNARRYSRERNVALRFQHAALDTSLPAIGAFVFDAFYQAGRSEALVGGDWYDAFSLRDGRIVVSVGDVVGSGLDAAIAMVNVRQAIRGVAQVHPDPSLMLAAADRTLQAQHPDRYVTAFVGVIDPTTCECAYANAGHPPPLIRLVDGGVVQVTGRGLPIGLAVEQELDVYHIAVPSGALLVLYTDGLTEATRDIAEGERRLEAALRDPDLPLAPQVAHRIHEVVVGAHARDDVAILAVTIGATEPLRRWRFDASWADLAWRTRAELGGELERLGFDAVALTSTELIFSELMGNLVRHAPGVAEVLLERTEGRLVLHVLDKGPGFAFAPRLPSDVFRQSGRGLFVIAHLADEFSVERRPGGGSHARVVLKSEGIIR